MDFADRIRALAARIPEQCDHVLTEEATKSAFVMPFIAALGYDVFDPREVTPELTADVGVKKGEKVDYAILRNGVPIMIFECKACTVALDETHVSQLFRYFTVTPARIGILTNGIVYRFFSDLEEPNKMDSLPFLEVDLNSLDDASLAELGKFAKDQFDLEAIKANASDLKYTREIKRLINREIGDPSDEFVRFFASKVYPGRMTQAVREQFSQITKQALQQLISDRVSDRLKAALKQEGEQGKAGTPPPPPPPPVRTTEDELHGYYIVQAILTQLVDPARVVMRDQLSYCAVLLDDNNRRPICRLWFNGPKKYVGVFDAEKHETRVPVTDLADIFRLRDQLVETVQRYGVEAPR